MAKQVQTNAAATAAPTVETIEVKEKPLNDRRVTSFTLGEFLQFYNTKLSNCTAAFSKDPEKNWGKLTMRFQSPFGAGEITLWVAKKMMDEFESEEIEQMITKGKCSVLVPIKDNGFFDFSGAKLFETKKSDKVKTVSFSDDKPM